MAVLITGGYGLIGSELARILVNKGETVWVLDKWIAPQRFSGMEEKVTSIQADLGNFARILEAVKESSPRVIFHLGGMLSYPSNADPQSAFSTNVAGTYHVLEAARLFNVSKVIFTSTIATYGLDLQKPVIDDFTLQRPVTMYGSTKVFGELLGRFYKTKYGIDFRALRFPSVVGPGAKTAHISIYNAWAVEKAFYGEPYDIFVLPEIRCPVLYFKDAARSLLLLEAAPAEAIQTVCYLIAGIKPMSSAAELVAEIKKHFPKAVLDYKPDTLSMSIHSKAQGISYNDSQAEKEWGWKVEYSLERMIADFYEELRKNPDRYR
ncbi:MAG: NAD-dependent epimerase/dehydratase family protein [Deltaproteobacteria bacterium]|nr:NAD-dependent epimerase/dehydratase family protein [Deltaproteobacteria bacterium]